MRKMGGNKDVSERCLNHAILGLEGVYHQGDHFKERKAAISKPVLSRVEGSKARTSKHKAMSYGRLKEK